MAYQRNSEGREGGFRRKQSGFRRRKKVCVFCGKDSEISYKDVNKLKAKHQRAVTLAVKRARHLAILPYVQD